MSSGRSPARRLIQKRRECVCSSPDCRLASLLARGLIIQSSKPMIGKAMPPFADNARLNASSLAIERALPAFGRQHTMLRAASGRLAACSGPGSAPRSDFARIFGLSRTSLASEIIPILNYDSLAEKSGY